MPVMQKPKKGRKVALVAGLAVVVLSVAMVWTYWTEIGFFLKFERLGRNAQGYREWPHSCITWRTGCCTRLRKASRRVGKTTMQRRMVSREHVSSCRAVGLEPQTGTNRG